MMIWWFIAGFSAACPVLLFLMGRRNEAAVARDWELLLTPKGEIAYRDVERRLRSELALAELAYLEAYSRRRDGSMDDALRMLECGCRMIEDFAPTLLRALAAIACLSRMVSAIAPVPTLRPSKLKLRPLVRWAHLHRFLHHLLVSTGERFRLKIFVLDRGLRVAVHVLFRSARSTEPDWDQLLEARQDLSTLTDESIDSFRVLVMSLVAERRQ